MPWWALGGLVGLDDDVVPLGDVLEVGEAPKHLLDRPPDHHRVLQGGHRPLLVLGPKCGPGQSTRHSVTSAEDEERPGSSTAGTGSTTLFMVRE
jgi:hypothetical protein